MQEKAKEVLNAAHIYLSNDALSLGWKDPFNKKESLEISIDAAGTTIEVLSRLPAFEGKRDLILKLKSIRSNMLKELKV